MNHDITGKILQERFGIEPQVIRCVMDAEREVQPVAESIDRVKEFNCYKVLDAMRMNRLSDQHFNWTTGYGYNDAGREKTESIFASVFRAEDALVRPSIVNGTHAISLCLTGNLFSGNGLLSITGAPYETLHETIGLRGSHPASLKNMGVSYHQVDLKADNTVNQSLVNKMIQSLNPAMIYIQRSTGYSFRPSLTLKQVKEAIQTIKKQWPHLIVMVDNCYGEFLEMEEPTEIGADLMAGSLIKNPGGGLALTGGYLVGKRELVHKAADRLTTPGIGKECGLTFGMARHVLQGLFQAPLIVSEALKTAVLAAKTFQDLGYKVQPAWNAARSDIIQGIQLNDEKLMKAFCQGIQEAAPVDSFVTPEAWNMPGYRDPVIMAAGAFVQGSSIELSADGPMRPPYQVYLQGGITYSHGKLGIMLALQRMGILKNGASGR